MKPLTLTLDNGSEFNGYADIEKDLDLEIYFADVHAPWQRGSNENINGLLRFFFPRGTDFRKVTRAQLDAVLDKINNRPRKCLDLLSPIDYFNQSVALGLTI
ncbi:IS30 family transposase [Ruminococcus bovis]|uniref:IS30 family transposase n=1 Tax=Ruminococcus bovis TaxID=2564099 RepID=A0A4V1G5F1_9FIRM|nr:IS30 family transposase [Ruminococcus bovis]QCT07967.1 IS30 family transposase [Ruminococcus bovis]QCT07971.1 IS30 family transposase [Ruminococcus bovis]QCT07974.1 IS30 family transposase [Ruminococcus bovis]QCT08003.1 IS30 family transposase [Ruminococcus bovis]